MPTVPIIIDVYPASGALGIPVGDPVVVTFDQEMDLTSINTGTLVVIGPDRSTNFGPVDITPFDEPGFDDEDILSSPYVGAYVKGTFEFTKVDASGGIVDDSVVDEDGDGTLWSTVVTFTPDKPLEANKKYTVVVAGDEAPDNDFQSGVTTRTVFDTKEVVKTGTADVTFYGGYTGTNEETYVIEFISSGPAGDAEYIWWKDSDPLTTYAGVSSTGERELDNGVRVTCDFDGSFASGDKFSVFVTEAVTMPNSYRWEFNAGSGSVQTPPSTSSASGIDSITTSTGDTDTTFFVSEITPDEGEYGVTIQTNPSVGEVIEIIFSENVDSSTVTNDRITLTGESAVGDDYISSIEATGELVWEATVEDNVITIVLDPEQLFENNIITIVLDKEIAGESGDTLGTDYISFFTTPYNPLYSTEGKIRLDLGPLIADVERSTIMLAILEASLDADANSFVNPTTNRQYFIFARRQYTTCLAEQMLVKALAADPSASDRMTKTLGDLSVSRGGMGDALRSKLGDLETCIARWSVPLKTGGNITPEASMLSVSAVKGRVAEDKIVVDRQWEPTTGVGVSDRSGRSQANTSVPAGGRRWVRSFRKR